MLVGVCLLVRVRVRVHVRVCVCQLFVSNSLGIY